MFSMGKSIYKGLVVFFLGFAFLVHGLLFAQEKKSPPSPVSQQTRSFRMGFTPFPPDTTPQAAKDVTEFIKENADIVAQHMESVPWTEALSGARVSSRSDE